MSLARAMYDRCGAPQLLHAFVDDAVLIEYEFGDVLKQCRGIIRDVRLEFVQGADGTLEKRTVGSLVLSVDEYSIFGGVADPQLKGVFIITDACGEQTRWSVASVDGNAISSKGATFVQINIMQTRAAARSAEGFRR